MAVAQNLRLGSREALEGRKGLLGADVPVPG